jgi:hypothetical protein
MNKRVNPWLVGLTALLTFGGLLATARTVGHHRWQHHAGQYTQDYRGGWHRSGTWQRCPDRSQSQQPTVPQSAPESTSVNQ